MIAPGADAATAAALPGRLPAGVVPVHYDLRIEPDAGALTFSGHATIDVEVAKPTATITLNALDLDIESARLDRASAAVVTLDPQAQTATLRFENPVEPGRHQLAFDYRGKIQTTPAGLFATDARDTPLIRDAHDDDVFVPIPPDTIVERLERIGFRDVALEVADYEIRLAAVKGA